MIIAIDFDGTCVTHDYPSIGRDVPRAVEVLKKLVAKQHRLILYTMRGDEDDDPTLGEAVEWFSTKKIPLYEVNVNPEQRSWTNSPKVLAHLYIDDAALGIPLVYGEHPRPYVDWNEVERMLIDRGII